VHELTLNERSGEFAEQPPSKRAPPVGRCGRKGRIAVLAGRRPLAPGCQPGNGRGTASRLPSPVDLNSGSTGGASPSRTTSVAGRLPRRSEDPHSESDTPRVPSSAVDREVVGGCARGPRCRTTGNVHLPVSRSARGLRWALASAWRTIPLTSRWTPARRRQFQSLPEAGRCRSAAARRGGATESSRFTRIAGRDRPGPGLGRGATPCSEGRP
jgi:hypothetical protein